VRVAVCCPGPSLPRRWPGRAGYDQVYAVNRAMITIPDADWLSAADIQFYQDLLPDDARPRSGVLTGNEVVDLVRSLASWSGRQVVGWGSVDLIAEHQRRGRALSWSVQAALCHAADSGAAVVDLYGCDGAAGGTRIDCTGYAGESRGPHRWAREETDLALTFALLAERGIPVHRIDP
jgi:hypothetical protein